MSAKNRAAVIVLAGVALTVFCAVMEDRTAKASPPAVAAPAATVPVYTAVYSPEQGADLAAAVRELAAEVKALREAVARLQANPAPAVAPAKAPGKPDPVAVATRACAGCHAPAAAEDKGGGFRLFGADEMFAPLEPRDRHRVAARVSNGSMPPRPAPALGAAEKAALVEAFRK